MLKRVVLLSMALALALPAVAWAQAKPDFSGSWKLAATNPSNYPGSAGWGVPSPTIVVKQTANEITVASAQYGGQLTVVYKLDGSDTIWEAPSATQSGSTAIVKWRTKARWDGNKLVLYTWNTALNQLRDTMTLSGGQLTIARVTENPGGSTTTRLFYNKS